MGWLEKTLPMKVKLAVGLGAVCAPAGGVIWLQYQGLGGPEAGVMALAASLAAAGLVFRAIAAPHAALLARIEGLAAGDLASHTPHTERRDCVGRMARAMETCRLQRRQDDEARRAAEDERRMVMGSLAEGLAALALARKGVAPPAAPARPPRAEPVLVVDNSPPADWDIPAPRGDDGEIRDLLTRLGQDRRHAIR